MQFSDIGIILSGKRFKENSFIVRIFTQNHGIYSGVVTSRKKAPILEGCLVDLIWRGRLAEHLGIIKYEVINSYTSSALLNKTKLYALRSIISLVQRAFKEKETQNIFFDKFNSFLFEISKSFSVSKYIEIELLLLEFAGYKIDFTKCVITDQSTDLVYVSPKSAKAVCRRIGNPYKNKLLPLPANLIDTSISPSYTQIKESLRLTSYFIKKHILQNYSCKERELFLNHIVNNYDEDIEQ